MPSEDHADTIIQRLSNSWSVFRCCLPREAPPSRPGCPIRPFSFFPKNRPMDDLMLFLLLDLCSESWLLLELLPSADRLRGKQQISERPEPGRSLRLGWSWLGSRGTYLRNSLGSSIMAPGCVSVILSSRRARGVEGGVESSRARARSSSLLFWSETTTLC